MELIAINNDRFDSRLATLYLEMPAGRSIVLSSESGKVMKRMWAIYATIYTSSESLH